MLASVRPLEKSKPVEPRSDPEEYDLEESENNPVEHNPEESDRGGAEPEMTHRMFQELR